MPALDKPDSPLTTTVKWRFPSVHPEGRKFVVIAAAVDACRLFGDRLGLARLCCWSASRSGSPPSSAIRSAPRRAATSLIVAPADGLITMITKVPPPPELRGEDGLGRRRV